MENTNEFQFNGTVLTKYTGPGGAVTIPEGVTSIGDSAFSWCRSLTSVSIPEGVTSIGESAFELCSKLTSVTIPTGVRSIGKRAFSFCNNLTTVTIPDSVTSIGEEAFMSCNGLTDLTIPSGVMFNGYDAFTYCEKLIRLSLPKGVNLPKSCRAYRLPLEVLRAPDRPLNTFPDHKTAIAVGYAEMVSEGQTFSDELEQEYQTYIKRQRKRLYPNAVKYPGLIRYMMMRKIIPLTDVEPLLGMAEEQKNLELKAELLEYVNTAFTPKQRINAPLLAEKIVSSPDFVIENRVLKKYIGPGGAVVIPDGVKTIGREAFRPGKFDYSKVTSITIPNSVTSIKGKAFYKCGALTSITIPDSVTSIGESAFYYCVKLASVTLSRSLSSVEHHTFYFCSSLTSVTIPDGVTSIDEGAFYHCYRLASVTIPDSVTFIGKDAFKDCAKTLQIPTPKKHKNTHFADFDPMDEFTLDW